MTATVQAERAAAAALYWARPWRRGPDSPDMVRGCVAGLSDADRAEAARLVQTGTFNDWTDEQLLQHMAVLATKAGPIR